MPEFYTSILEIPSLIRRNIWRNLCYDDLILVRQVCSAFKREVDHDVGLTWTITEDHTCLSWFQQIRVRKCVIRDFTKLKENISTIGDFLNEPFELECLHFLPITPIFADDILTIIRASVNLTELAIHTMNKNLISFSEGQQFLDELLELVQVNRFLRKLHVVIYSRPKSSPRESRKCYHNSALSSIQKFSDTNSKLKEITIECPWIDSSIILDKWKRYLERQRSLKTLVCNFGLMFWGFYAQTIKNNSRSLEKIILRRVTGINPTLHSNIPVDLATQHDPFDWEIFSQCEKLRYVKVVHDDISFFPEDIDEDERPPHHQLPSINLNLFPAHKIEHFHIRDIQITEDEIEIFREKSKETLRRFRGKANVYIDEGDPEFLDIVGGLNWYDYPAIARPRNIFRRMMNYPPVLRGTNEDDQDIQQGTFLNGLLCAAVLWICLIISFIIGPFVVILLFIGILLL